MATINGTAAADTLNSNASADRLNGLGNNDTLNGGGGNDTLDGGAGGDRMNGGAGDDLYFVNAAGDDVVESPGAGSGTDSVSASITYTLTANVENLLLTGGAAINGTGNTSNNQLSGNTGANKLSGLGGNDSLSGGAGNDTLDGGAGNDTLVGGAGNDVHIVNALGDTVTEAAAGGGTDTVRSSVDFVIGANVENLTLTGGADLSGIGNTLHNVLLGNAGENVLHGGAGNDSLNGGAGVDILVGGAGDDVLTWDAADAYVNGGAGTDTLRVTGAVSVDLTSEAGPSVVSMEVVDLAGTNTLTLGVANVLASSTDVLRVAGGTGDAVAASGGWVRIDDATVDTQTYAQYVRGVATLQVDLDIDQDSIVLAGVDLDRLDGTTGFRLVGAGGLFGKSVASAGDVNGDGYDDLIIGEYASDPDGTTDAGATYVVFGGASGFASSIAVTSLDGTNGFRLDGVAAEDFSGFRVASAGDVNGDGLADLLIGAIGADPAGDFSGSTYLVFGSSGVFGSSLDLSALDGTTGFRMDGAAANDQAARAVASAGDVNGDGYDDILVGASGADPGGSTDAGVAYVVFGNSTGFASALDLTALDGSNGFQVIGAAGGSRAGSGVAAAGDINGDGIDDILVGAGNIGGGGTTYVIYGTTGGFLASIELSGINGINGFVLVGPAGSASGYSIDSAGDINGDGLVDLIIGGSIADAGGVFNSGETYVVFGREAGFPQGVFLTDLNGVNGFRLSGSGDNARSGYSVASAGDVNGDGLDDLLVGALRADPGGAIDAGESYLVFGAVSGFSSNLALSELDGTNGFRLVGADGNDRSGVSVDSAGDLNGDGFADILIGAQYGAGGYGASYVLYGRDFTSEVTDLGTATADTLTGTAEADSMVAGRGNDTMTGAGGADVFRGGAGDDRIEIADAGFADVDGGSGSDTLALAGGFELDLTQIASTRVAGIEIVDLVAGAGASTVTVGMRDVLNLSDVSNTLTVEGDGDDTLLFAGGGWVDAGTDGDYHVYTNGAATLRIDADIDAELPI